MKKASGLVLAFSLCLLTPPVSADPLVVHARQLEKAGDNDGAARLYFAWLAANPGASGSAAVFDAYRVREQNLSTLLEKCGWFLQSGKGVPGAAVQFERIARLFNLAGRIEEARGAYMAAHSEGAPDSTLVSAFFLSLQMNDTDMMSASLKQMSGKGETAELFLQALSDARAGDSAAAYAALVGLADQTGNPELALKALWILYEAARSSGDSAGQATLRAKLTRRFGPSPETALAAGPSPVGAAPRATVVQMPAPGPLEIRQSLPADSVPPAALENTSSTVPALPSSPLMAVQAGSFLMKENADDLVSELSKRGFSPVVVHETAQGKDRYRVLAGTGLELEAAKIVLKKLSDAGYRGFLLQVKELP